MRKRLIRLLTVLGATGALSLALVGVANANVPAIYVGSSPIGSSGDCIGVILDQDGHYNVMDSSGNGYDARLCAPGDTRTTFGWGHAGGYFMYQNQCTREDYWTGSAWSTLRQVCTGNYTLTRFLDSASLYRLVRTK